MHMNITQVQIDSLLSVQWIGEPPCIVSAGDAHRFIFHAGGDARYYLMHWWHENLAGMTQFMFDKQNRIGQSELMVWKMNRQDTAMDVKAVIDYREPVQVYGGNCDHIQNRLQLSRRYTPPAQEN